MEFKAYIFDLDGTLLDTLADLVRLTNMVLGEYGWPSRTREEILSYVGNGGRSLLTQAAPPGTPPEQIDAAFATWQELYPTYGHAMTAPYQGIPETLALLKEGGAKLGVLSNKFDSAVKSVIVDQFPGMFDQVRGECEEIPRKPNPAGLQLMMDKLGVSPDQAAYIGDSPSDITVARNAGVFSVGVAWGYRSVQSLEAEGAHAIIYNPDQLLNVRR